MTRLHTPTVFLGLLITLYTSYTTGVWVEVGTKGQVGSSATAFDPRLQSNNGCNPSGCTPALSRDGSLTPTSRWSCSTNLGVNECSITYSFGTTQPFRRIDIAFYRGNERTREFEVDSDSTRMIDDESSGNTLSLERFGPTTEVFLTDEVTIVSTPDDDGEWFSLTEVDIWVIRGEEIADSGRSVSSISATGFDDRTNSGCNGQCLPSNSRDGNYQSDSSRWSCQNSDATGGLCSITYGFSSSARLDSILVSLFRGDKRIRSLRVYLNGNTSPATTWTSSGDTDGFEEIEINRNGINSVKLEAYKLENDWLSIKETFFYVSN
ncbi:unnamed protein product [Choristocarpus tenellus]